MSDKPSPRFAFFGTPHLATVFLDDLAKSGLTPALIVTTPDRRVGRGLAQTSPPVKVWADSHGVPTLQTESFDEKAMQKLGSHEYDVFVVIYYGKLIPKTVLDIPKRGVLNIHFSLLPRWRGTSPVRAAIAHDDREVGTTVMLLDEKLDHGPIIAQKKFTPADWPPRASALEEVLTHESAHLLAEILPAWLSGDIEAHPQNHDLATECPALEKTDGLLDLSADPYTNLLKIRAYDTTIGTYAMFERPSTGST